MKPRDDREQQQAELLWKYIEELKRSDQPDEAQFVAVTRGECAEVVGLMETAAEAYALARAESAPNCRREAVRQRLRAAFAGAPPAPASQPAAATARPAPRPVRLPAWLTTPLSGRSTGWAVAVAALVALLWTGVPRPQEPSTMAARTQLTHGQALDLVPQLIAGTLDIEKERDAWEHFNRCDHCFEIYEEKWRAARSKGRQTNRNGARSDHGASIQVPAFVVWREPSEAVRWADVAARSD